MSVWRVQLSPSIRAGFGVKVAGEAHGCWGVTEILGCETWPQTRVCIYRGNRGLSPISRGYLAGVQRKLNAKPKKVLHASTPAEVAFLLSGVALRS